MYHNSTFYGTHIDRPLSLDHNTADWPNSEIAQLHQKTKGAIFIREVPVENLDAEYCWRVVNVRFSQEDTIMTYFKAYDLDGEFQAAATFGVYYDNIDHIINAASFKYVPEFGANYYVPVENKFATPNSGGYTVQVLDITYPSEGLGFGLYKQGAKHSALEVSFRLFKMEKEYPNDKRLMRQLHYQMRSIR